MASVEQLMSVGENCRGYDPASEYFQSSVGEPIPRSCSNCNHFTEGRCNIDLFDTVLTSLDQG
ncbi:hypothetical protein [Clostridium sp. JN-9]|uniref:hypothetical protein n=1 Tax=Clostridium sp. JN-9 TaxID=2507159 RepID=UPI000FFE02E4|nr:hypothetical protein [Clostridium sp. JN-9]QAT38839.1 hypothetical protein EQM05_00305 [Clostridium sp. JN-9]